jgi:hypothetical protein
MYTRQIEGHIYCRLLVIEQRHEHSQGKLPPIIDACLDGPPHPVSTPENPSHGPSAPPIAFADLENLGYLCTPAASCSLPSCPPLRSRKKAAPDRFGPDLLSGLVMRQADYLTPNIFPSASDTI